MKENKNIATSIYNAILSKTLLGCLLGLGCIFMVLLVLYLYQSSFGTIFFIYQIIVAIIAALYGILLIMIANKTVIELITNTFEFWFQVYNLSLYYGAVWIWAHGQREQVLNGKDPLEFIAVIFWQTFRALAMIIIFLLNAIPFPVISKSSSDC